MFTPFAFIVRRSEDEAFFASEATAQGDTRPYIIQKADEFFYQNGVHVGSGTALEDIASDGVNDDAGALRCFEPRPERPARKDSNQCR